VVSKAASGSSPAGGRDRFGACEAGAHKGRPYVRRSGDPRGRPRQSLSEWSRHPASRTDRTRPSPAGHAKRRVMAENW